MNNNIIHVNDSNFDTEVLKKKGGVLVDFWAEWCGPCQMIAPVLHEVAENKKYAGKVIVAKLNVDENSEIPKQYGIRSIPALLLFKEGEHVATKVGALSKTQLEDFLDTNL